MCELSSGDIALASCIAALLHNAASITVPASFSRTTRNYPVVQLSLIYFFLLGVPKGDC